MITEPWRKIYVKDWIAETRILSIAGRGAYADLQMYLWLNETKGALTGDLASISRLLGVSETETEKLLAEIFKNRVLKKEDLGGGQFRIVDEQMMRKVVISNVKSAAGATGGKKTQKNNKNNKETAKSTDLASAKANDLADDLPYNNSNSSTNSGTNDNEERGEGERRPVYVRNGSEVLDVDDCLEAFMTSGVCGQGRDLLLRRFVEHTGNMQAATGKLRAWGEVFNEQLKIALQPARALNEWSSHFSNWLNKRDITTNPKESDNGNKTGNKTANRPTNARILQPGDDFWTKK